MDYTDYAGSAMNTHALLLSHGCLIVGRLVTVSRGGLVRVVFFLRPGTANESVAAPQGERTSLCYGELGCLTYDATWFDPIRRPVNLLPSERDQINTRFFLYTRHHPDTVSRRRRRRRRRPHWPLVPEHSHTGRGRDDPRLFAPRCNLT